MINRVIYFLFYGLIVIFSIIATVLIYKLIFKKKKVYKYISLLATIIGMLGVLILFNPPETQEKTALTTDVRFFCRSFAIIDRQVFKTLISNDREYADYELIYTINNNFDTSIKIDDISLKIISFENIDVELISPEGGGGGDSAFHYYYCKLDNELNNLTYLGSDYGNLNPSMDKKSYLKIDSHDLEVVSVYFDCDNPGLYELSLCIDYSGNESGKYISKPIKIYIVPYDIEQEKAKVIPLEPHSDLIGILYDLSEQNEKISNSNYEKLQKELK